MNWVLIYCRYLPTDVIYFDYAKAFDMQNNLALC